MSQRLRGISDEESGSVVKQVFDASNQLLGRTANLLRILAHSPHIARWFLPLVAAVRQPEEYNRRQHGAVGVTAQALEDYACRICSSAAAQKSV